MELNSGPVVLYIVAHIPEGGGASTSILQVRSMEILRRMS